MIEHGQPTSIMEKSFIGAWLNMVNHQLPWKYHL